MRMASLRRCDRLRQLTQADGAGPKGAKKKNWTKIVTGLEECDLCESRDTKGRIFPPKARESDN